MKMVRAKKTGVRSGPQPAVSKVFDAIFRTLRTQRYALKCVRKRDVVEKNVQDALVSELSILKEAWFAKHMPIPCKELCNARWITHSLSNSSGPFEMSVDPGHDVSCRAQGVGMTSLNVAERTRVCISSWSW